tara:strand:+ start:12198 stop:12326 length:129 start_codon:yes stop_codon:yes gene_type:complete
MLKLVDLRYFNISSRTSSILLKKKAAETKNDSTGATPVYSVS